MKRLSPIFYRAADELGFAPLALRTAEQTHGKGLAIVSAPDLSRQAVPEVDGLLTNTPGVLLGIMVADCAAVYLVDPVKRALALVHSGKRGTELGIVAEAISAMNAHFESRPEDLIVQLSPCIRPPCYEVDIPAAIRRQVAEAGVPASQWHDCGVCTACHLARYYSYRAEKGHTGRMLAMLGYGDAGVASASG